LKAEGYEVSKASNGADGIDASKKLADLIVLDLMMQA
jgi:CheY-like chemotaxis protein